jgi:CheY-like chemotaxis protein
VWDKQRVEQTGDSEETEGNNSVRVVLADDHAEFRRGVAEMLLTDGGIEVVGEAKDGAEAIEITREERPDVVVLDLAMPLMGGREALGPILMEVSPPPGIVILTMHDEARAPADGGQRLPGQKRLSGGDPRRRQGGQPEERGQPKDVRQPTRGLLRRRVAEPCPIPYPPLPTH